MLLVPSLQFQHSADLQEFPGECAEVPVTVLIEEPFDKDVFFVEVLDTSGLLLDQSSSDWSRGFSPYDTHTASLPMR